LDILRIVICDTNPAELERCTAVCRAVCERKQLPALFTTFPSSQALLFQMMHPVFSSAVSILVLEPFNGCEVVAEAVRKMGYDGIILYHSWTTEKKYFYQAFDAGAFNYIEKGGQVRFETVFEEALKAARELERQYIALRFAGEYRQIDLRDIYYFEASMNHMVCVWYASGKFLFRSTLSELEQRLSARDFVRVHRSYLVAIDMIHRISFEQVTLINGAAIPVGRSNFSALKEAIDKRSLN
jgi:DNA-binding LytR/AlgR family response regulator